MAKTRIPFIAGNWKMNMNIKGSAELADFLKKGIDFKRKQEILVAPPFTALRIVAEILSGTGICVAAQDMHWEEKGAYTGAVSPLQIKDAGCSHVILGHSERRRYFGDNEETIKKKISAAVKCGMAPIVCIGETLEQREANLTFKILETQINGALSGFGSSEILKLIIAYEPVWAIGTGRTASPRQAQDAHVFIRRSIETICGVGFAEKLRIIYGGSVNPENIDAIMAQQDVDGVLVGGESLKADRFLRIINFQSETAIINEKLS